jgi:hypothetical protein
MRVSPLVAVLLIACVGACPSIAAETEPSKATTFVNHKVSARKISVNQPLRLEFTTLPRQIEGIDIAAAVTNGVTLSGSGTWRLSGKPLVAENEKTRTATVTLSLLPRTTGDLALPSFPLTWLTGDPRPDFGIVTVAQSISISGETKPLPPEYDGVAGFLWGAKQEDLVGKQIPASAVSDKGDRTAAKVSGSLELGFRAGELADATLLASGVTLDQSRTSFCERWGLPLSEDNGTMTWVLGWTRITASPSPDGVKIDLLREDIQARQAAGQVRSRVFNLLEAPPVK